MNIHIRNANIDDYQTVEAIMRQVQQMHIDWRPDIYKYCETVLPIEVYEQAVRDETFLLRSMRDMLRGFCSSNIVT